MILSEGKPALVLIFSEAPEKGNACEAEIAASGKENVGRRPWQPQG